MVSFIVQSLRPERVIVSSFLAGLVALFLWQLGPKFGFQSETQVLDALKLEDGSRVLLAQCRRRSFVKPYNVVLVRIYPDQRGEAALVDFGNSYWWLAKLRRSPDGDSVEIRALGALECRYVVASNCVARPDRRDSPSQMSPLPPAGWLPSLLRAASGRLD
jgi:hypothetical protein